ncbi:MAG TPA: methyltransferase [Armatimonadota bacterium]|nr:methyltransferase [Armatimonadota bacterium]
MDTRSLRRCTDLLGALRLASPAGRQSAGTLRKLRQIEGMLPWLLGPIRQSAALPPTIIEFGCGKGCLSFFLAAALRGLGIAPVRILGVDRNLDLMSRCMQARSTLGWDEVNFTAATCEEFAIPAPPLLVTSLHACDVVTDHVLAAGIHFAAENIVAAPCCQSTVQRSLRHNAHDHQWGYVARSFPLLGSRFSEFVTEAMRCLALRASGYEVRVREFVSSTATPKNVVIVARRAGLRGERAMDELRRLQATLGLKCEVLASLARRHAAAARPEPARRKEG